MDIREQNLSEKELIKKIREIDKLKRDIHKLLKELIIKTDIGSISDDWCDDAEIQLGEISIFSCGYYHDLKIETNDEEIDINYDLEAIKKIYNELVDRYNKFIKKTRNNKIAEEIFNKKFELN